MCLLEWALIQSDLFCYERKELGDMHHSQVQNNDVFCHLTTKKKATGEPNLQTL